MTATAALTGLLLLPLLASPVIYLAGRLGVRRGGTAAASRWLALLTLLATVLPLWLAARAVLGSGPITLVWGGLDLHFDGMALLLGATVLALTTVVTVFSIPYVDGLPGEEKYYALLTAMMATVAGLGAAGDLFNLWVWFEAMAVTSYLLVAFHTQERAALEAGVKYLVQSAVGSVLVLLGIALVLGQTGSLDLASVRAAALTPSPALLAAGALFLIGFGVKSALVPLHTWLPDAHSQAPSGISAMLSGVVIEAGLVALLRSVGSLADVSASWGGLVLAFGALNMIVGNLMALRQTQVKRLLAYSSVAHMGYMLVGFGVAIGFGVPHGAAGGFFHLMNHALMKGLAFLAAGCLLYALHAAHGHHPPLTLDDLDGAHTRYPFVAFALAVGVLALGGLPPLSGFMSKWQIFVAGFETRDLRVELLVIFAALNSVLSLAYYAPIVNRMYRHHASAAVRAGLPVPRLMEAPLAVLVAAVLLLGFWPALASRVTLPAGRSLIASLARPAAAAVATAPAPPEVRP